MVRHAFIAVPLLAAASLLCAGEAETPVFVNPDAPTLPPRDRREILVPVSREAAAPATVVPLPQPQTAEDKGAVPAIVFQEDVGGILLQLDDCVEISIQNNLGLKISRLSDRASDISLRSAWADYYPDLAASVGHSNSRAVGERNGNGNTSWSGSVTQRTPWGTVLDFSIDETHSRLSTDARGSAGFSVTQPLWKGAGTDVGLVNIRTARIDRLRSRGRLELDVQSLIFNVRQNYSNVIRQIQNRDVSLSAYRSAKKFLELTVAREAAGQQTKLDVFNAEVQLGNREIGLISAARGIQEAYDSLKQLMDVDLDEKMRVEAPVVDFGELKEDGVIKEIITDPETGTVAMRRAKNGKVEGEPVVLFQATHYDNEVILKEALDNRIDLLNTRRGLAIQKLNTMFAKDGLGHQIDLSGGFDRSHAGRSFFESENGNEANNWSVGLNFRMPWGKIRDRAAYERALLDLQRAEIDLKQARTTVQLDVRTIMRQLKETEVRLLILGKQVEQAKRSVEAAQISFERGLKDSFDVIRAEDDLLNAKSNFINGAQNYQVLLYNLEVIVGKPTQRVDLSGESIGGLIDSKLPDGIEARGLPKAAPEADPLPADDPWNKTREYRKDYKPNKRAPVIIEDEKK